MWTFTKQDLEDGYNHVSTDCIKRVLSGRAEKRDSDEMFFWSVVKELSGIHFGNYHDQQSIRDLTPEERSLLEYILRLYEPIVDYDGDDDDCI